jgi:hypothetical protein
MDKKYIEENGIETKYLREQLRDDELEAFEVYLMENPDVLESLAIEAVLVQHTDSVQNSVNDSKKLWFFIPAKFVAVLSVLLISLSVGLTFNSLQQGDKELELYSVRGTSGSIPVLERTRGQKYWPFKSAITLKAQVANAQSFSNGLIERLQPSTGDYKEVKFYSDLQVLGTGDIAIDIELDQLVEGRYRVVLKQVGTDVARRDLMFQFLVK